MCVYIYIHIDHIYIHRYGAYAHTVHAAPPALCWQTARALPPPPFPRDRNAPSSERDGLRRSLMGLLGIMGMFMGIHGISWEL